MMQFLPRFSLPITSACAAEPIGQIRRLQLQLKSASSSQVSPRRGRLMHLGRSIRNHYVDP